MAAAPRILIVTAAFGEGHNSAARNLATALNSAGATTLVSDPCMVSLPKVTSLINNAYRFVTNRLPNLWAKIYYSTENCDFSRQRSPLMRIVESCLADQVKEFQPDAIVSTYPLYPYFLTRIFAASGQNIPVFIVVTDSIEINGAWLRAKCRRWLVTDAFTKDAMIQKSIPADQIVDTGFPVHPAFSSLPPVKSCDDCGKFRILYFATASRSLLDIHSRAILDASATSVMTIILGKNLRRLYSVAKQIKDDYPGRVKIVGWTRKVPTYLNSHHLVVGKAGGATVHEAIAAQCPMLIHHLVPGQEEGNLRLLEKIGAGRLAETPEALTKAMQDLLSDNASGWRLMKNALISHGRNAGAIAAASFILDDIGQQNTNSRHS